MSCRRVYAAHASQRHYPPGRRLLLLPPPPPRLLAKTTTNSTARLPLLQVAQSLLLMVQVLARVVLLVLRLLPVPRGLVLRTRIC